MHSASTSGVPGSKLKPVRGTVYIENHSDVACPLNIYGNDYTLEGNQNLEVEHQSLITKS